MPLLGLLHEKSAGWRFKSVRGLQLLHLPWPSFLLPSVFVRIGPPQVRLAAAHDEKRVLLGRLHEIKRRLLCKDCISLL